MLPRHQLARSIEAGLEHMGRERPEAAILDVMAPPPRPPPIREAAFASLMAPLPPVPALVDPTDASGEREASGRRRILQYDNRKTTARPARSS
jgi:hypothetical protein